MWFPPLFYALVTVLLWWFARAFFVPQQVTNRIFPIQTTDPLLYQVALSNVAVFYFGAYWAFSAGWKRLRPYLKNEFVGGIALWAVNVLVILPLIGRGIFGYKLNQGALYPCMYLFATHWMYARMLQMSVDREN